MTDAGRGPQPQRLTETKPQIVYCTRCGTANVPEALFCRACGAELSVQALPPSAMRSTAPAALTDRVSSALNRFSLSNLKADRPLQVGLPKDWTQTTRWLIAIGLALLVWMFSSQLATAVIIVFALWLVVDSWQRRRR